MIAISLAGVFYRHLVGLRHWFGLMRPSPNKAVAALSLRDLADAHAPGDQAFSVMKRHLIKSDRFGLCAVVVFGTLR